MDIFAFIFTILILIVVSCIVLAFGICLFILEIGIGLIAFPIIILFYSRDSETYEWWDDFPMSVGFVKEKISDMWR